MSYTYDYPRPAVTTDCVIFCYDDFDNPKVLLIRRANEPYKDHWAFPGGFLDMDETADECAIRELKEETGLFISPEELVQIGAFTKVDRDPRGRTITIAFCTIIDSESQVKGLDDAADARWFPIENLPPLAFDHEDILDAALEIISAGEE